MLYDFIGPCAVGCVLSLLFTPVVRLAAIRLGIVDAPDGFRKLHGRTVPLGGGVSVALSCALALMLATALWSQWAAKLTELSTLVTGVTAGAVLICFVGLVDDRFQIRGRQKLLAQIACGLLAIAGGLVIQRISLFGYEIELGLLAVPFTLFWLLGAINALNLIDGMDGLATSVAVVLSMTICFLANLNGHHGEAAVAAVLAGSLLGFLPYNWRPAKIFLGDAGSMFCGYLLGVLAIRASLTEPATTALIAPTAIWAIPFLDVGVAILRRKLTGQSIYATDRGHMHHVLRRAGYGEAQTVMLVGGLCLICGLGALLSTVFENELGAMVTVGGVVTILVMTRSFGHPEFCLVGRRIVGTVKSFLRLTPRVSNHHQLCSRFHGSSEFKEVWKMLIGFAERFGLTSLNLNINAPMLGEVYHARWDRGGVQSDRFRWESRIPLVWRGHDVGGLTVIGAVPNGTSPVIWSTELMDALRPFEIDLLELLNMSDEMAASPSASMESDGDIAVGSGIGCELELGHRGLEA